MANVCIRDVPAEPDFIRFRDGSGQRFIVTVDAEEEFDWDKPLVRDGHGLATIPQLGDFQRFCEGFGVVPIYLLDYPVASSELIAPMLADAVSAGRAEIGIQLHPWVNPPFDEEMTEANSFVGNLPPELEREKLARLREVIAAKFGAPPLIYRAGRYGVGPNTAAILSDFGIPVDTSVRARFDYSYAGGPNFRDHPHRPYWIDRDRRLIELPLTSVYWGLLRQLGGIIYPLMWRVPTMRGALARLGLLERIPLTPEGVTIEEAIRGIDIAIDEGLPVLVFSFHSPSLATGHTPYVQTDADLAAFYDWWRAIFAHLQRRGIAPSSVNDILSSIPLAHGPTAG